MAKPAEPLLTLPIIRHIDRWDDIHVTPLADGSGFKTLRTFRVQYQVEDGTDYFLTIPIGFVTDWASIPGIFRTAWKSWGWWSRAALVHDCLYHHGAGEKSDADALFGVILRMDEIPEEGHEGDIDAMVLAVRIGGRGNFDGPPPDAKEVLSTKGYSHQI